MNSWAWIGLSAIIVLTLISLGSKENRSKDEIRQAIITIGIVIGIIIVVVIFNMDYLLALFLGLILYILFDKKTYTKKRLFIYGGIVLVLSIISFFLLRYNPDYVLNHLKKNPETSSLYVVRNGDEMISYQENIVRPLASTVKIPIAMEYAFQIHEGILEEEQPVSLDALNRFFYEGTDGGAHEAWLDAMNGAGKVNNQEISLHDVAKGMITYSSNANTDYLMHLLGISNINERIELLGLTQHEPVYPLVSPLLIPETVETSDMKENEVIEELEVIPLEHYRALATDFSEQMKDGTIDITSHSFDLSLAIQRVWSDRLPGATAKEYGQLLSIITNDELPDEARRIMRDLMEWPMEINEANKDFYIHLGSKGGSTAFILNDALYAEDLDGNTTEIVLFTDDLNWWQSFRLQQNLNSFEVQLVGSEEYRKKVAQALGSKN
jgi:D-alanyl-D-alanine carboxypeptidase